MIINNKIESDNVESIQLSIVNPEQILKWSSGEVTKPETINYKSQKCERDGLFCEVIFGPTKDWECSCGKYKKIRFKGTKCERCEVEVISSASRRQRIGHITLATPVFHIWYLNEFITKILDIKLVDVKEVVYFVSHIVLDVGNCKELILGEVLKEQVARRKFETIIADIAANEKISSEERTLAEGHVSKLANYKEAFEFHIYAQFISKYTNARFGIGAEAIQTILSKLNINEKISKTKKIIHNTKSFFIGQSVKRKTIMQKLEKLSWFKKSGNKPEWLVLDHIPVLPPDLRPMIELDGARFTTSDINDLYRRIIIRNNRLKKLILLQAPAVILYNERRMLQEAVDALINNGGANKKVVTGQGGRALKSLSDSLKGKQGRFRQNLLGKRVDYSGRSVISVGPELKMHECGLPREMAIILFKPFVIHELVKNEQAPNIKYADKMCEEKNPLIWLVLEKVIKNRPVLLNRAPTLHRLGIQAFIPKLIKGKAIRLHPLVTTAFNADFDGDQMAVHVPISKEAIAEAKVLMIGSSNILGSKDGKPIVTPSQDMVLGNYYLTKELKGALGEGTIFKDHDEVVSALENEQVDLHAIVAISTKTYPDRDFNFDGYILTTPGKIIFNNIFADGFPYINSPDRANLKTTNYDDFVAKGISIPEAIKDYKLKEPLRKNFISDIILEVFNRFSVDKTAKILDKIKDMGFKYSTLSGTTIALSDIKTTSYKYSLFNEADKQIDEIKKVYSEGLLTNEERHNHVVKIWTEVKNKVQTQISNDFRNHPDNPIFMMADSGARGNISNFTQLVGMRGLMSSPYGDIIELPIKSSFTDGLKVAEFFISTHGARKGIADTAFKTGTSGYLTRILVDSAQDVTVLEHDCKTDHGFKISEIRDTKTDITIIPLEKRLKGRMTMYDIVGQDDKTIVVANKILTTNDIESIIAAGIKEVEIRSIFTCQTAIGVCQKCYGINLTNGKEIEIGEAVGVIAAQSVGEPGTQLTMRTFHTGGVAGQKDITQGLPRILELLTVRWNLNNKAVISEIAGKIKTIKKIDENHWNITVANKIENREYKINSRPRVQKNEQIEIGAKISEGSICPRELLYVSDETTVQNYIIKEVQKIFSLQGIDISDKHIEIFIKKMLRKVVILDEGGTGLLQGKFIDRNEFTKANQQAMEKNLRPALATPIIEGIMSVSENNESFIATSSFQTTTKKLREAAIEGGIDTLKGIKENVVLGKLIPAGMGIPSFKTKIMMKYEEILAKEAAQDE